MQIKKVQLKKDFKEIQQDVTELNGDGNRDRGRYGEDLSVPRKKLMSKVMMKMVYYMTSVVQMNVVIVVKHLMKI